MFGWAKALLAIAGSALAMPVTAQAPTPPVTAFDGNYVGISAHVAKSTGHG